MLTKMGMKTSLSNEEAEAAMHQAIEDDQNGVVSGSAVTRTPHRAGGLHALWKRIDLRCVALLVSSRCAKVAV